MATSISLTDEDLAREIRESEGSNNNEKLKNWARNFEQKEEKKSLSEKEIRDIAREEAETKIQEYARR